MMELGTVNRTVTLMLRLLDPRKSTVPLLPISPQKPSVRAVTIQQAFPRVTPESQGISSAQLAAFLNELQQDHTLNMHTVLILRNGKLITEAAFGCQEPRIPRMTFSACKSIVSLAIGLLVDDGRLSLKTKVAELFPDKTTPVTRLRYKDLTVEHLLTMTSGISFNEAECMTESDWVRACFASLPLSRPGRVFTYNSLNTYLLGAVVTRVSGEPLAEFLKRRLWEPLGITEVFWETCPEGMAKGGWGLYIAPEDLAKVGQLVLQNGIWNGEQLISESYLRQALTAHREAPKEYGDFDYGYQFWVGRQRNMVLFNGMLGQNVLGFPDSGILVVSTAGNDELFQQSRYFDVVQRYFGGDFPDSLPNDLERQARLAEQIAGCRALMPAPQKPSWWRRLLGGTVSQLPPECAELDGTRLRAVSANASSVGLLPVLLQVVQNNYTAGLLSLELHDEDDRFVIVYREVDGEHRLPVGFTAPIVTELYFHGEPYRVAVRGHFARNEYEQRVLLVTMDFAETPCTRIIKLVWEPDGVHLYQTERPGEPFLRLLLDEIRRKLDERPLLGAAMEKVDEDYILYKIRGLLCPEVLMEKQETPTDA